MNELLKEHFMNHIILYFITILSFTIGICAGAFTVNALDGIQAEELYAYLEDFFYIINGQNIEHGALFRLSLYNNIKMVLLLWLFGITVVGIPFILITIGIKGFGIGFTVGCLIKSFSFQGILFTFLGILPQNLIMIPCYIILAIVCINFSLSMLNNRKNKRHGKHELRTEFLNYCTIVVIILFVLIFGCIVEAYIVPVFIKTISTAYL